jgi:hypothetical protein
MSLSANTHRRIVWTVRVLLTLAFGAALSGFVAYRLRPTRGVLTQLGAA